MNDEGYVILTAYDKKRLRLLAQEVDVKVQALTKVEFDESFSFKEEKKLWGFLWYTTRTNAGFEKYVEVVTQHGFVNTYYWLNDTLSIDRTSKGGRLLDLVHLLSMDGTVMLNSSFSRLARDILNGVYSGEWMCHD